MNLTEGQMQQIITGAITILSVLLGGTGSLLILYLRNRCETKKRRKELLLQKMEKLSNDMNDFITKYSNFPNIKPSYTVSFTSMIDYYTDVLLELNQISNRVRTSLDLYFPDTHRSLQIVSQISECMQSYNKFFSNLRSVYQNASDDSTMDIFKKDLIESTEMVNERLFGLEKAGRILSMYIHEKFFGEKLLPPSRSK